MAKLELDFSNLQKVVNERYLKELFKQKKRFILLYGGSGSGKSVAIAQWLLVKMLKYRLNILCIRNIAKTIKHSVKANLEGQISYLGLSKAFKIKEDEIRSITGNKIIFMGLDDPEKLKSISDIDMVWVEEATEVSEAGFKEINRRLRGISEHPKQIILTFNPTDKTHFIYKYWFDPMTQEQYKHYREKAFILHTTYKDNKFLDQEYINEMLAEMDEYHKTVYTLGIWYEPKGETIFNPERVLVNEIPKDEKHYDKILYGVDFGFTHATVAIKVGLKAKQPDAVFILDEIYLKGATTDDLIKAIEDKWDITGQVFWCDSAEPDRIFEMQKAGIIAMAVKKGSGSVDFALDWLISKKIIIHPDCQNTVREVRNYRYKKDRSGNLTTKLPTENDDTIAAIRYAILEYARAMAGLKNTNNENPFISKKHINEMDIALQNIEKGLSLNNILTDY